MRACTRKREVIVDTAVYGVCRLQRPARNAHREPYMRFRRGANPFKIKMRAKNDTNCILNFSRGSGKAMNPQLFFLR